MALTHGSHIPDDLGYEIAEAMGVEAFCDLGYGVAGKVFALEDGRILKVTIHANEAAIGQLVMERAPGFDGPLFPPIHDVRAFEFEAQTVYGVVRDDIACPGETEGPGDDPRAQRFRREWGQVFIGGLGMNPAMAQRGVAALGDDGAAADEFLRNLAALIADGAVEPYDIGYDSIGETEDGRFLMRDYSHFLLPEGVQDSALRRIAPATGMNPCGMRA